MSHFWKNLTYALHQTIFVLKNPGVGQKKNSGPLGETTAVMTVTMTTAMAAAMTNTMTAAMAAETTA